MAPKIENWLLRRSPLQLYLMTYVLGGVGALALPPLYIWPALVVMFFGLMIMVDCLPAEKIIKRSFVIGWWFGFGYFTGGLYWISASLWVDIERFWWVLPFSLFGLPAILALFTAPVVGLMSWSRTHGIVRVILFASLWVIFEWLRGHLFTGFPWNLVGSTWNFSIEMMQSASLVGAYGLTFLAILAAFAVPYFFSRDRSDQIFGASVFFLVMMTWLWGYTRVEFVEFMPTQTLHGRIVQPSIPQTLKWDPAERENNFRKLLALTAKPATKPLDFIVWPESAVPFMLEQDSFRRDLIADVLPDHSVLLLGGIRRMPVGMEPVQVWNSVLALSASGDVLGSCDKFHLVPFGEYFPLREYLGPLNDIVGKMTPGTMDFTPGPGPQTLTFGNLPPVSPLVCYEVIFPSAVVGETRPQWLLNVTNDGWYGETTGPYQHLESARLRAIEEGVPLVRAANTGISAVYDAVGRKIVSLGLSQVGVVDFILPSSLKDATVYSRFRDSLILFLCVGCAAFCVYRGRKS